MADWKERVKTFITKATQEDAMYRRRPPVIFTETAPVVFAIDTSGAIRTHRIEDVWGTVQEAAVAASPGPQYVTVTMCDCQIRSTVHIPVETLPEKLFDQIRLIGRGGTLYAPVFERKYLGQKPACVVYCTDLLCPESGFGPDPGYPVLWAAIDPPLGMRITPPPFGEIVSVGV